MLDRSIRPEAAPAFLSMIAALVASNLSLVSPAAAQPGGQVQGAAGGRYFEYNCGPGRLLVGLRGSAGILIDNIQAICGRLTSDGGVEDIAPSGPIFGGGRPQDKHVACPAEFAPVNAVVSLNEYNPQVGSIALHCVELANRAYGGQASVELRGSGNLYGYDSGSGGGAPSGCDGQYAVGIRGRAQDYLSAFGLICGDAVAERTLGKRKKPVLDLSRRPDQSTTTVPGAQRTLNKRRRPAPTGGAASEMAPPPDNPYTKGGPSIFTDSAPPPPPAEGGFSINSDSQLPPPTEVAPAPEVSPLIAGEYLTQMIIRESRCIVPVSGSWQQMIVLEARPVLVIPIYRFNNFFDGPLALRVNGTSLTQTASVSLAIGGVRGNYPAQVTGGFDPDYRRFEVRFEVDAPLCSFDGFITGTKP